MKMKEVRTSYDDCLEAQSQVYGLEKISGAEDSNWNWVVTNLKKPLNDMIGKAEDLLDTLETPKDPEADSKAQLLGAKRDAKMELSCFEAKMKAEIEGALEVFGENMIWMKDNHEALTVQVEVLRKDLNEKHIVVHRNYLKHLDGIEGPAEETRFGNYREKFVPKLAKLQAGLKSKTPVIVASQAPTVGGLTCQRRNSR